MPARIAAAKWARSGRRAMRTSCGAEQPIAPSASRARLEGPLTAARAATPSGSNRAPVLVLARAGALDEESERHECAPKREAHR